MKSIAAAVAALVLVAPAPSGQGRTDPPLVDMVTRMARVGRAASPTFSPDGTRVAYVSDQTGVPQVWMAPTDGGAPVQVTKGDDPVGRVAWAPTGEWLAYSLAPGGGMNTQVYVVRADGTGVRRLTAGGRETNNLAGWTHDGSRLAIGSNQASPSAIDVYLVDPASAEQQLVSANNGLQTIDDISRDRAHALVGRLRGRGDNNVFLVDLRSHAETLVTPHTPPGSFSGQFAPDGRAIYLSSDKDRDKAGLARVRIDPSGRLSPIELVAGRDDAELSEFEINEQGTTAAVLWNVAGRNELAFVDLASGRMTSGPKLPGEIAGPLTFSKDGRRLATTIGGASAPSDVWLLDVASGRFRQLTHAKHEGVDLATLVHPELVKFPAHDGLELSGWLYRAPGAPSPGPFVVSFHGGPEGQERPSFRADYQALVAQGIGVFAPNVRGSSGFGKRFVNLDNGALRFEGIKDLKDSVDYLVAHHLADPKRIGITGGSYGGYMTLVGVTFYPDVFAAAVDLYGMVNFFTFFEHTEPWMAAISTTEYGDPKTQPDLLRDLSPLGKLDRIRTPLMVQHGANDTNVPVVEAEQVVSNLKQRGVPVEYILFPDEGHGFRKEKNRITSTVKLLEFFVQYLGGPATSAGAAARSEPYPRIAAVHRRVVFADMHAHPSRFHRANVARIEPEELARYRRGLIDVVVCNVSSDAAYSGGYVRRDGTEVPRGEHPRPKPGEPFAFTLDRFARIVQTVSDGDAVLATSPEIVLEAKQRGQLAVLAALEGADGLEARLENLDDLYRRGLRLLQLVHFRANELGHIQTYPYSPGGLTPFGREAVREANRLGIVIDLAHANTETVMDVVAESTQPVLFSHTGLKALDGCDRCLSDDEIKAIAAKGGIVGIWPNGESNPLMEDMVRHIDYVRKLVGVDHVGIGSDLRGMTRYTEGFGEEADFQAIAAGLLAHGYSDSDVGKVMGGNFFRVWQRVAAAAQ